jgi:hypothetical protein
LQLILERLASLYVYDLDVLTTWWVWMPVVPALLYMVFMLIKWAIITIPVWLPFYLVFEGYRKRNSE